MGIRIWDAHKKEYFILRVKLVRTRVDSRALTQTLGVAEAGARHACFLCKIEGVNHMFDRCSAVQAVEIIGEDVEEEEEEEEEDGGILEASYYSSSSSSDDSSDDDEDETIAGNSTGGIPIDTIPATKEDEV